MSIQSFRMIIVAIAMAIASICHAQAQPTLEYDLIGDWNPSKNPNGPWSFAHGTAYSPLNHSQSLMSVLPNGTGYSAGVSVVRTAPSNQYLTVGSSWWDLPLVIFTAPVAGKLTFSGTLFNIGASDIHYEVVIRSGPRPVYPSAPTTIEFSLLGTDIAHPTTFQYTEPTPLAHGDVAYLWFYPENCCGDANGIALHASLAPVPEPQVETMITVGLLGFAWRWRKRDSTK